MDCSLLIYGEYCAVHNPSTSQTDRQTDVRKSIARPCFAMHLNSRDFSSVTKLGKERGKKVSPCLVSTKVSQYIWYRGKVSRHTLLYRYTIPVSTYRELLLSRCAISIRYRNSPSTSIPDCCPMHGRGHASSDVICIKRSAVQQGCGHVNIGARCVCCQCCGIANGAVAVVAAFNW